jgi:hypothetical protein
MADNNELQTSRLISGGPGSYVDNDIADFEAAMRTIFKVTADSDLSAVSSIGTGPDMTLLGTLTLAGDPTDDLHACTKQYVDTIAGTGAAYRATVILTGSQTVNNGNTDALEWDTAHIEAGSSAMWNIANPSRLVTPVDGDYLFVGSIEGRGASSTDADFDISAKLNGSTWLYTLLGIGHNECAPGSFDAGVQFAFMEPMNASDYIEIFAYAYNANQVFGVTSQIAWFKVG